jgi:hypothetical protein
MDPAFGPLEITNLAPSIELRHDLDRKAAAFEHPLNRVARTWPGTNIHFTGTQRYIAGNR